MVVVSLFAVQGAVAVELSSYSTSIAHAPFNWRLTAEGTKGSLKVLNWGYPWLWNRLDITELGDGRQPTRTRSEEVYAPNDATTFDEQLKEFARRCRVAEMAPTTSTVSSLSSASSSREDLKESPDNDAETWWQKNVTGESRAAAQPTDANAEIQHSLRRKTGSSEHSLGSEASSMSDDGDVNEVAELESSAIENLALVESVLEWAGQKPIGAWS